MWKSSPKRPAAPEPSHKELKAKLALFAAQVHADTVLLADPKKFRRDLRLLRVDTGFEMSALLDEIIHEVRPEHYCPPHERKKSYEGACFDAPMYDFAWDSAIRGERMYVKFAVVKGKQCFLVSCHPDLVTDEDDNDLS